MGVGDTRALRMGGARHVALIVALLVGLQGVYFVCNLVAELLPTDVISRHLEESADDPLLSEIFEYDRCVLGSPVSYDNNRFIEILAEKRDYGGNPVVASIADSIAYTMPDATLDVDYYRYWHGWQLPVFLVLMVGDIRLLSMTLAIFVTGASAFYLVGLARHVGWAPALAFTGVSLLATGLFGNFMGDLLMALAVFTLVTCCGAILRCGRGDRDGQLRIDCLCATAGSLFCFLDFFTVPSFAIAFATFSALVASDALHEEFAPALIRAIRYSALFLLGFVFTWASKWLMAASVFSLPTVIDNVTFEVGMWSRSNQAAVPQLRPGLFEISPRLYAVVESFEYMVRDQRILGQVSWLPAGCAGVAATFGSLVALVISRLRGQRDHVAGGTRRDGQRYGTGIWACLLPALYAPAYAAIVYHHTIWHMGIFGHKPWSVTLGIVAGLALYAAQGGRRQQPTASAGNRPRHLRTSS